MNGKLAVGKIANTQGLKGHLKIYPYTNDKEEFEDFNYLMIEKEGDTRFEVKSLRYQKNMVIVLFEGLTHINEVEKFKNREVYFMREDLGDFDEHTFMFSEIVGYQVIDQEKGLVGTVKNVHASAAHELIVVEKEDGETFMIPCVKAFILGFDHPTRKMNVNLIEGMIE
ncbi:ribosome maturation factor RimM [Fusibacter sp. JL216-2]|uniref:ribosome maturation factor RimM n=1 Tax=Fusibacter sp. JL216-2 TaxID=3071453 RepID=UPI003D3514FD